MLNSTILTTKFHRPAVPVTWVERPAITETLNTGLDLKRQFTLVSAPAGFGKTMCISRWVESLSLPAAWLSLDEADDDAGRFFVYFISTLQKLNGNFGQEIKGVLQAGQLPGVETICAVLIEEILNFKKPFLLVLDDFQFIQDKSILKFLETLIKNPPATLYLTIITREDPPLPLARLRANNGLTEIRADDLRFSKTETGLLFKKLSSAPLSLREIQELEKKTEGWAAGLQLIALSLQGSKSPSEFIAGISGSHRFILNYLVEEVIEQQPEEIRDFLLQTSILGRLNGNLCDAVTGRKDSRVLLEKLFKANLFLIPLDDQAHWYRYHKLFRDLLRDLLKTVKKEEISSLHRRASLWFSRQGMVNEAIQHALSAEDYSTALEMIEVHGLDTLMQWHIKTVGDWRNLIPQDWIEQSPRANLAFAWMFLMQAKPAAASPYLLTLQDLFSDPQKKEKVVKEDPSILPRWLVLQSLLAGVQRQLEKSLHLCQQALGLAKPDDSQLLTIIYQGIANAYHQMNDYENARQAYQKLIGLGKTSGYSVSELLGISGLGLMALQHGEYHYAYELVTQGVERLKQIGTLPPSSTAIFGELGVIHYQWHQLDKAHEYFQRAIHVSALSGYNDAKLYYSVILSRLSHIKGDLTSAAKIIEEAAREMKADAPATVGEEILAQRVRIFLAQGNLNAARNLLSTQGFSFDPEFTAPAIDDFQAAPLFSHESDREPPWLLYFGALRILLHESFSSRAAEQISAAVELATRLINKSLSQHYLPLAIEGLLVRSQLFSASGETGSAKKDICRALELAAPEEMLSIFIEEGPGLIKLLVSLLSDETVLPVSADYISRILSASAPNTQLVNKAIEKAHPEQEKIIEPLSERELEILSLIKEGLTNQQIADRLVITLHTVKKHSSNIYLKLGVKSRTQAVATARKSGLV